MNTRITRHRATQALTLMAACCMQAAHAQATAPGSTTVAPTTTVAPPADTPAATPTTTLPGIDVSSGRLSQHQWDAPAAVSVLQGDALHNSGAEVNLSDVLAQVPGMVALNRNNYAQDNMLSVRGFGAHTAVGLGGLRLITDGIPAITPDGQGQSATVSLTSADRIEVLKGPLGQLYGNASGGVIQTFTREAGLTPELSFKALTGSYGLHRSDLQFSDRIERVGAVVDWSTFGIQGYRANANAHREQWNGVLTSDLQPGTRLRLVLASNTSDARDPTGLTAAQLASTPGAAGNNTLLDGARKRVTQQQAGVVLEQALSSELRFTGRVYGGTRDNMQYQATSSNTATPAATWISLGRSYGGYGLQLDGRHALGAEQRLQWVLGLDEDRADENRQMGSTNYGVVTSGPTKRNELDRAGNRDYFAQANWVLGERWTLVGGMRHNAVTLESDSYLTGYGSGQVRYGKTTPVLGATWHVREDMNLYANLGQGFETPTLLQTAYKTNPGGNALVAAFNPNLLASSSHQQEVGMKWTPAPSTRVDLALFHIDTDNEIVAAQSANGQTAYTNAGKTTRQGLELALQQASGHWRGQLSFTTLQASYQSGFQSVGLNNSAVQIASGNRIAGIPAQQLYSALQWSQQGYGAGARPRGWELTLEGVARASMWADDVNAANVAGYGLLNLRVRNRFDWQGLQMEAFASIDNLANRSYVGSVIVNQSNGQYYEPGLPRNYAVGLQGRVLF